MEKNELLPSTQNQDTLNCSHVLNAQFIQKILNELGKKIRNRKTQHEEKTEKNG